MKFISEVESIIYMRTRVLFISAEQWRNYKEFPPPVQPGHGSKQSKEKHIGFGVVREGRGGDVATLTIQEKWYLG